MSFSRSEFRELAKQCNAIADKTADTQALLFGDIISGNTFEFVVVEDDSPEILEEKERFVLYEEAVEKAAEVEFPPQLLGMLEEATSVKGITLIEALEEYKNFSNNDVEAK